METIRTPAWLEPLFRQIAASAPEGALLLTPASHPLRQALETRLPRCRFDGVEDPAVLPPDRRYALAIVAGLIERLSPADARHLLAALRDRLARHTVLWIDLERSPLSEDELRALGFRIHARDGAQLLCGFDLQDYKDTPDWLNSKHWAHPELWDKFRW